MDGRVLIKRQLFCVKPQSLEAPGHSCLCAPRCSCGKTRCVPSNKNARTTCILLGSRELTSCWGLCFEATVVRADSTSRQDGSYQGFADDGLTATPYDCYSVFVKGTKCVWTAVTDLQLGTITVTVYIAHGNKQLLCFRPSHAHVLSSVPSSFPCLCRFGEAGFLEKGCKRRLKELKTHLKKRKAPQD